MIQKFFAATCVAALISVSGASAATVVVIDAPNGDELNARFGLDDSMVGVTDPTGGTSTNITGDPLASFSDLYGPNFIDLSSFGLAPGDTLNAVGKFLSTANPGVTAARLQFRFYNDANNDGNLQFGGGSEFANRVEAFGPFADMNNATSFQDLDFSVVIPAVDMTGAPITHFEFAFQLPQAGEDGDQGNNSVVAAANVFVKDVSVTGVTIPEPSSLALFGLGTLALGVCQRRK
ncbi:MAG: PEP-CTERM sorting domain-containing protein [Lacipirellulaceae bacterium]